MPHRNPPTTAFEPRYYTPRDYLPRIEYPTHGERLLEYHPHGSHHSTNHRTASSRDKGATHSSRHGKQREVVFSGRDGYEPSSSKHRSEYEKVISKPHESGGSRRVDNHSSQHHCRDEKITRDSHEHRPRVKDHHRDTGRDTKHRHGTGTRGSHADISEPMMIPSIFAVPPQTSRPHAHMSGALRVPHKSGALSVPRIFTVPPQTSSRHRK